MKIGILTQPVHNSPGGILQAYALQTVLKRLGHDVWIVRRDIDRFSWKWRIRRWGSCFLAQLRGKQGFPYLNKKQWEELNLYTHAFVDKYLFPKTDILSTDKALREEIKCQQFDAYIVGSDQVWRPRYSPKITNYFLDFLDNDDSVKRIAYAASFGVDNWEFTNSQTRKCGELLRQFHFVSVREKSAIELCKKYFDVEAEHVLDPTLLLKKEDYEELVKKENQKESEGDLLYFILDSNVRKEKFIRLYADRMGLEPFSIMPKLELNSENFKYLEHCIYPSIICWLKSFIDAKFVITDSFHGTIFSILFNKPFIVLGNKDRGLTRMESLLQMFELDNRLVIDIDKCDYILSPIDWKKVNLIKEEERKKSLACLINGLN